MSTDYGYPYFREHWQYCITPGAYPGLDFLRFCAVMLVLLFHFQYLAVGFAGVDLFFALSGFLIGGAIIDKTIKGRFSFIDFYKNRALRILPIYYFVILLCIFTKAAERPFDWMAIKSVLVSMLFLETTGPYFFPSALTIDQAFSPGGAWSLVIEETFYVVAPAVLVFLVWLTAKNLRLITFVIAAVVASGPVTRHIMTSGFNPNDPNWYFASYIQFHSRYDQLAAGVLAACIFRLSANPKAMSQFWLAIGISGIFIFLSFMYGHPEFLAKPQNIARDTIWLPSLLALSGMSLVLGLYWRAVEFIPIIFIARISYALYLVHIIFLEAVAPYENSGIIGWMGNTFGFDARRAMIALITIFLSYLVSLLVEYPFIRMYRGKSKKAPVPEYPINRDSLRA